MNDLLLDPQNTIGYHTHNGLDSPLLDKTANGLSVILGMEYDNGNITGTATIDWNNGNTQYATMTGNVTLTFINPIAGSHYTIHLAGAFTPTFPASVRWTGGTTPAATATAGHKDIYTLIYSAKEVLYNILQSPNYAIT